MSTTTNIKEALQRLHMEGAFVGAYIITARGLDLIYTRTEQGLHSIRGANLINDKWRHLTYLERKHFKAFAQNAFDAITSDSEFISKADQMDIEF